MFVYIVVTRSCTADYVTNYHCVDTISVTEDSVGASGDTWLCTCSSGDLCNKSSKTEYMTIAMTSVVSRQNISENIIMKG